MEIVLINQFFTATKDNPNIYLAIVPINLLYLVNYLKTKGMSSKILEFGIHTFDKPIEIKNRIRYGISDRAIIDLIKKEKPKIVGIGCMYTRHYPDVLYIARLIREIDSSIKIVVGGNYATSYMNIVLKEKSIDFVVLGEGEVTFYELCKQILSGKARFENISGIAYRKDDGIVITEKRELISDLDSLPIVDYSSIDMEKYLEDTNVSPFLMRYPAFDVISSRGCPGNCIFCTVKNVWGRTWRGRSPNHFVDEIEILHRKYNIREFAILDDTASLDQKRWLNICNEIIERRLDIKWTTPNGIAHWTLNKPILKKMKEAGCYRITFGIESGNAETRRFIGKLYSLEQARDLINYANKIGMWTICTNIIGFPYETRSAIEDTVNFAKSSGTDFATFYLLCPDMTSDVYPYFRKENLLNFDSIFDSDELDEDCFEKMERALSEEGVDTKFLKKEQLREIQMQAYRRFIVYRGVSFLFTLRLIRKIKNSEDFWCSIRFVITGCKIFFNSFFKKNTHAMLYD